MWKTKATVTVKNLHVGSGPLVRPGWTNIDNHPYPGVDQVLDVREGLPYRDVSYIYAEHFIEHLAFEDGLAFLGECRRALSKDGVLRLSTPNLDWVWFTQYHFGQWESDSERVRDCFWMNKAFRGWGHEFLYNAATLEETLRRAGFAAVVSCAYGESSHPVLRGLEMHEHYVDSADIPHVVIAEAFGSGEKARDADSLTEPLADYRRAISAI